jgi:hypothetical protein
MSSRVNVNLQASFPFKWASRVGIRADRLKLFITSPGGPPEASMPEPVTLANGREVRLGRQGNQVGVKWNEGGRSFTASPVTSDRFSGADFLLALASLK